MSELSEETEVKVYLDEILKRIEKLRNELFDDDLERYEYLNEKQRAELREKYRLLKETRCSMRCGKNSRISKEFYKHYEKYDLFKFIYYDIPREIDARRLRFLKELKGSD